MSFRILIQLLIILSIFSCTKELKNVEKSWNPYSLNQMLIFESSEKEIDSLLIKEVNDNVISSGSTPKLYEYKSLRVYAKKLNSEDEKFSTNNILDISAETPDKPSEVTFSLNFYNARFAGWGLKLDDLIDYPTVSISTKAGTFDDVIKIKPVKYHPERDNEVETLYWSKENGFIKFERRDGLTWELIEIITP